MKEAKIIKKEYCLPKEIIDIWYEYQSAMSSKEHVLKSPFKFQYKKAVYLIFSPL